MQWLYGKPLADEILARLKARIAQADLTPGLAVILIGDDPASRIYVELKEKAAQAIGMHFERHEFPAEADAEEVQRKIRELNANPAIHGIILQLPLPESLDEQVLIESIVPEKDADGFHPETLDRFFHGDEHSQPVFPRAVARLIRSANIPLSGEQGIAIVNSALFGQVIGQTLNQLGLESRVILRGDWEGTYGFLRDAAVVVTACGEPGLVRGEMLRPNAIVIDGGITRVDGTVLGDVDLESVVALPGWIAPVPGGVGPLTVASLLERVVESALGTEHSDERRVV